MDQDLAIIEKVLAGQMNDFDLLLQRHGVRVFELVGRRVPPQDVETVAQDVFVSAYRSLGTYAARQPFEHWLARIARRRCCDYWRERERQGRMIAGSLDEEQRDWLLLASTERSQEAREMECGRQVAGETVRRVLKELNAEDRALIESVYFEEVPLREVAGALEWSLAKVKVRAHRARKKLRAILEHLLEGETGP